MEQLFDAGRKFYESIVSVFYVIILIISSVFSFLEIIQKPEIKNGEFDFSLVYEIDDEIKTIEGTYVCEFGGIDRSFEGASRYWNGYIAGHNGSTCYELKTTDDGVIKVQLNFSPEFFMSDPDFITDDNIYILKPEPYIYITSGDPSIEDPTNEIFFSIYEGDDIKIISFVYEQPIVNRYKYISI